MKKIHYFSKLFTSLLSTWFPGSGRGPGRRSGECAMSRRRNRHGGTHRVRRRSAAGAGARPWAGTLVEGFDIELVSDF